METNHNQLEPRKKDSLRKSRDVIIILTCLCVVVLAGILFYGIKNQAEDTADAVASVAADLDSVVPNDPEPIQVQEKKSIKIYDDDMLVAEDYYRSIKFELPVDMNLSYEYEINSGPSLDFYVVDEEDFFKWERMLDGTNETQFRTYTDLNSTSTSKDYKEARLAAGTYYLIIDNTDYGDNMPPMNLVDDVATLRLTVEGQQ